MSKSRTAFSTDGINMVEWFQRKLKKFENTEQYKAEVVASIAEEKIAELEDKVHRLEAENERLRNALVEIKEELEYDISNGKVFLDIAKAALQEVDKGYIK